MRADERDSQCIFYGNASTWLAQLDAGEHAWDAGIVWAYEGKWQAVLDHLLAQGKLTLLARQQDGDSVAYEPTKDPQNAWITEGELRQIFASPPHEVLEQMESRREEAAARVERAKEAKRAAGRYTLHEAADALAANAGGQRKRWLGKLMEAVAAGKLTVYQPGETDTYRPKTVRDCWVEAYGSDLNTWLDASEDRADWRFPPAYSPEFIKLRHDQAEAEMLQWKQESAARHFSEAVNFHHAPEDVKRIEYNTRADFLAAHRPDWNQPATPGWWAYLLAQETAERQGWPANELKGIGMTWRAMENNLRTLKVGAATLPLLRWPNMEPHPPSEPLPDNWQDGLFMRKAALREWAKVNAPHWLSSAVLREPQGDTALCGDELAGFYAAASADNEREWNGAEIDWAYWVGKMPRLTAAQAVLLMAGLDPTRFERVTLDDLLNDRSMPGLSRKSAVIQARDLERLAAGDEPPKERDTPAGWLAWADGKRKTVHGPYRVTVESARAQRERELLGRYSLWDAAKTIGGATAAPFEPVLEALIEAANSGELTIYQAGVKFPHKPDGPLGALSGHEAYWSDLNAWLRAHKVQGDFAFPAPQEAAPTEQAATVAGAGDTKTEAQRGRATGKKVVNEWTKDFTQEVRKHRDGLKARGLRDYTKRTAEKYGVTTGRIRQALNDKRIDSVWNAFRPDKRRPK